MTWVSAASATACSADTSCEDTTMATGVSDGNDITAAAKAFSDAAASCGGTATDTTATPDCAAAFAAAANTLAASCPAGCTYAEAGPVAYDDGREEAYKKGVFNQLMAHLCITTATAAVATETASGASAGDGEAEWNKAW